MVLRTQPMSPLAWRARAFARLSRAAMALAGTGAALLAQAADPIPTEPAVQTLRRLVQHPHPVVRGEAGLLLAQQRDPRDLDELLALARSASRAARHRGILALGISGIAGTEGLLSVRAEEADDETERQIAAFALGLLPEERTVSALSRLLQSARGGGHKSHREIVLALLAGLAHHPNPTRVTPLRELLHDPANKDPELLTALIHALARTPDGLRASDVEQVLDRKEAAARIGILNLLGSAALRPGESTWKRVESLATHEADPAQRAAALEALTRCRRTASLEQAVRAIRSSHPAEVEAAANALSRLGGTTMRELLETMARRARKPLREAIVAGDRGTPSPEFARELEAAAADPELPLRLRADAALLAARQDPSRMTARLRDLFLETEEADTAVALARCLQAHNSLGDLVERVRAPGSANDVRKRLVRLHALLVVRHESAMPIVLAELDDTTRAPEHMATVLRVWRKSVLGVPDPLLQSLLPPALHALDP